MNSVKKRIFLLVVAVFGFSVICNAAQKSDALLKKSPDTKISITQQIKEKACAFKEVIKNNGGKIVVATLGCLLAGAWFTREESAESGSEIVMEFFEGGGEDREREEKSLGENKRAAEEREQKKARESALAENERECLAFLQELPLEGGCKHEQVRAWKRQLRDAQASVARTYNINKQMAFIHSWVQKGLNNTGVLDYEQITRGIFELVKEYNIPVIFVFDRKAEEERKRREEEAEADLRGCEESVRDRVLASRASCEEINAQRRLMEGLSIDRDLVL